MVAHSSRRNRNRLERVSYAMSNIKSNGGCPDEDALRFLSIAKGLTLSEIGEWWNFFSMEIWNSRLFALPLHLQTRETSFESKDTSRGGAAG